MTIVYLPLAHWVFDPDGWFVAKLHLLDFAGGTAVETNSGAASLALAFVVGKRVGWPRDQPRPHNLPLVMLGAGILWFGWFGFNAGSALAADGLAATAFLNTMLAGGTGLLGWLVIEQRRDGKPTTLGAASGAVAGLVGITPACGFVEPLGGAAIGLAAGVIAALAIRLKYRFGFDDSLDVVAVHGIGGLTGLLATGLLATTAVNAAGANGLFYGGGLTQLGRQALAALVTIAYSGLLTLAIAALVQKTLGLRATREAELAGIDEAEHAETAYDNGRFATHHTALVTASRAHGGRDDSAKPPAALPESTRHSRTAASQRPGGVRGRQQQRLGRRDPQLPVTRVCTTGCPAPPPGRPSPMSLVRQARSSSARGGSSAGSPARIRACRRRSAGPGSMPSFPASSRRASSYAASASACRPHRYRASMNWPRNRSRSGCPRISAASSASTSWCAPSTSIMSSRSPVAVWCSSSSRVRSTSAQGPGIPSSGAPCQRVSAASSDRRASAGSVAASRRAVARWQSSTSASRQPGARSSR